MNGLEMGSPLQFQGPNSGNTTQHFGLLEYSNYLYLQNFKMKEDTRNSNFLTIF